MSATPADLMTRVAIVCFANDMGWSTLVSLKNADEFLSAHGFTHDEHVAIFEDLGRRLNAQGAALAAYRGEHGHA